MPEQRRPAALGRSMPFGLTTCIKGNQQNPSGPPCGRPGRWHILWPAVSVTGGHYTAIACHQHFNEDKEVLEMVDAHEFGGACGIPGAVWHMPRDGKPSYCAIPLEDEESAAGREGGERQFVASSSSSSSNSTVHSNSGPGMSAVALRSCPSGSTHSIRAWGHTIVGSAIRSSAVFCQKSSPFQLISTITSPPALTTGYSSGEARTMKSLETRTSRASLSPTSMRRYFCGFSQSSCDVTKTWRSRQSCETDNFSARSAVACARSPIAVATPVPTTAAATPTQSAFMGLIVAEDETANGEAA